MTGKFVSFSFDFCKKRVFKPAVVDMIVIRLALHRRHRYISPKSYTDGEII
jgi:hypothetical protein